MSEPIMSFLFGPRLREAIQEITASGDVDCAVAFWGNGAEKLFADIRDRRLRIICNLRMGGTNPSVISKMRSVAQVRHSDTLHAKVYSGSRGAVITSANASTNGLGVDEAASAAWDEAGCFIAQSDPIRDWFEQLWRRSKPVTDADIERAKTAWGIRQSIATSIKSSGTHLGRLEGAASPLPRLNGDQLNKQWQVGAEHALYRRNGTWYHRLERFPGALFDEVGYVRFETEEDLLRSPGVLIGTRANWLNVPAGISSLPGYVRVLRQP